jgi:UTP--glucose-1-phosphate uridylyltransferase
MSNRPGITKAVIPAAGFGTRMLPATKAIPKEMLPVAGKPLIQYAVEEAIAAGAHIIIIVVRGRKSLIEAHFACDPVLESFVKSRPIPAAMPQVNESLNLQYVEQEEPCGLAHAISCAKTLIGQEPFVILLPDVIMVSEEPVTQQLIRAYDQQGGNVIAIRKVEPDDVRRHGIVRIDEADAARSEKLFRVTGLVEKPSVADAPSWLGVFGRYLLQPEIWDAIASTTPDSRGEIQLTDALDLLSRTNQVSGLRFEGRHYDAGDRLGYLKANIELSLLDPGLHPHLREYLSRLPA